MSGAIRATDRTEVLPVLIAIPVYNDWGALARLFTKLDEELQSLNRKVSILVVDDGSTAPSDELLSVRVEAVDKISLLSLRRNLGHQRAIAIALAYIEAEEKCEGVIIMDADGQDKPSDLKRLIGESERQKHSHVIFAERTKRSEKFTFRISYRIYRRLFYMLTGQSLSVGNFSLVPATLLSRVVVVSEIWNHYSSGIMKAKIPCSFLPCDRGTRLLGDSKMNYVSLVTHGLSAISVFGDIIGVRALMGTLLLAFGSILLIVAAITIRSFTSLAIPGWATYVVGLAIIMLLQSLTLAFSFVFLVLNGRDSFTFLPQRDYRIFVSAIQQIQPRIE